MPLTERPAIRAQVYTVPFGIDLSEATAALVLQKCNDDPLQISAATLLLPNNRAVTAMTEAFVRRAKPGLLLPRMVAVGDLSLDESMGPMLDPLADDASIFPVIAPAARLMLLAQLVAKHRPLGQDISPAEALRLARHLAEMIDELEIEQVGIGAFRDIEIEADLQSHWQSSYGQLMTILPAYRNALAAKQMLGPSERRNILLDRLSTRLRENPPTGLFVAAGITTAAKAVARVLANVAKLPMGIVVLPGVDLDMPDAQWETLGPHLKTGDEFKPRRSNETHPQFHLKLLLVRMGIGREEIEPIVSIAADGLQRATTITDIFYLPDETASWGELPAKRKQLPDVYLLEAPDSAAEARGIAIKVRQTLEAPQTRISVVTPDRELAVRVAAQLRRWNIVVDDSAGTPLLQTPNGTLILALAEGLASRFAPVSLLAIAKHPLVHAGDGRLGWLEMARRLDLELRGPATGKGLKAVTTLLASSKKADAELSEWWREFHGLLAVLENTDGKPFADIMATIQDTASMLTANGIWKGATGRQFAELWEEFAACDISVIGRVERAAVPAMLTTMVVFGWENLERQLPTPRWWICQFVLDTVKAIIPGNQDGANIIRQWGYSGLLEVMPQMGVDPNFFSPRERKITAQVEAFEVSDRPFNIGYLGRLAHSKGIDLIFAAVRELRQRGANVCITLCGSGADEAALKQEAETQQVADLVIWRGAVRHEQAPKELGAFDVLVLPSRTVPGWKEQFGHVLIEAMAMGIPVVGSSSGEIPNVIGRSDLVFPEEDALGLTVILERLIHDSEWYQQVSQYGIDRVSQHYSHERIAKRLINLWHSIQDHSTVESFEVKD